jgi:hypothetical protein
MARHDETATGAHEATHLYDFALEAQAEFETICDTVCARIRNGSLPPDEAYWWTRILFEEGVARLAVLAMLPGRATSTGDPEEPRPSDAQAA